MPLCTLSLFEQKSDFEMDEIVLILKDYVERQFSIFRGKGGPFCLYPTSLQFCERLIDNVTDSLLESEKYDLLSRQSEFEVSDCNDATFIFDPNLQIIDFPPAVLKGLTEDFKFVSHRMRQKHDFSDKDFCFNEFKLIYTFFVNSHPKDGLLEGKNRIETNFAQALHTHFKSYSLEVLTFITKFFIYKRINHMKTLVVVENKARNVRNAEKRAESLERQSANAGRFQSMRAQRKLLEWTNKS